MLPFLTKNDEDKRRLETLLQQKECRISNLEVSLAKAKTDYDGMKTDSDRLQNSLRESSAKILERDELLQRYSKDLRQRKEHSAWLQEQMNQKQKEMDNVQIKLQEALQKYHQKNEDRDRMGMELQNIRRELDQTKLALEKTENLNARLKAEAGSEIHRLNNELAAKIEAIRLLELSDEGKQMTEDQKLIIERASHYERLNDELKEFQKEHKRLQGKLNEAENLVVEYTAVKKQFKDLQIEYDKVKEERSQFAESVDRNRKLQNQISEVNNERHRMQEAIQKLEEDRDRFEAQSQSLTQKLTCTLANNEVFEKSSTKAKLELQEKDQELNGIKAACERLEDENKKLYEHVCYAENQIVLAKEAIHTKQGILDNERAMGASERKVHDSLERLVQNLREELQESRRQISELVAKDRRASDAINALEKKLEQAKTEQVQNESIRQFLDKELKASQVESLRLQQALSLSTTKLDTLKNRLGTMKEEMAASERTTQDPNLRGNNSVTGESVDPLELQERIKMLEADLVIERNSHSVTKKLLKQESETRSTHVSTPFPRAGSSFRFSYARPGDGTLQGDPDTPVLKVADDLTCHSTPISSKNREIQSGVEEVPSPSVVTIDAHAISAIEAPKEQLPLTPVREGDQNIGEDDEAMDVDDNEAFQKEVAKFSTPGPKAFHADRQRQLFTHSAASRRATYDFHEINQCSFAEQENRNTKKHDEQ